MKERAHWGPAASFLDARRMEIAARPLADWNRGSGEIGSGRLLGCLR